MVAFVLAGCGTGAPGGGESPYPADNGELQALYEGDQGDRSVPIDSIDWSIVSRRDSLRRARVLELLDSSKVVTAADYHHAAMVFQHGSDTSAARLAYELARESVRIDSTDEDNRWLMAAAWDRWQMRLGRPQWYGTQFVRDGPDEPWRLYEMDTTAVTDEERVRLGVPPLAESRARVAEMNGGQVP